MLCPQCGYLMSALDKDCVRCRNLSAAPPATPKASRAQANQIEWDTPPPQTMAFMPMNSAAPPSPGGQPLYGQPLNGQPLNNQPSNAPSAAAPAYAPPPAYTPYTPVPAAASSEPSGATQMLMGALGALLIVGYVGLRVYLYEARQERKQAAMLDLNAHYNDTMRRQFDTMQMQEQTTAERAQQDVNDAMQNAHHGMSGAASTTVFINPSAGPAAQQMMMQQQQQMIQQQQMQMQNRMMQQQTQMRDQIMQQQQQMRDRMMQNHGGMGGGFGR